MRAIGKIRQPTSLPQMRDLPITFVHETARTPDWALVSHPKLSGSRNSLGFDKITSDLHRCTVHSVVYLNNTLTNAHIYVI